MKLAVLQNIKFPRLVNYTFINARMSATRQLRLNKKNQWAHAIRGAAKSKIHETRQRLGH